MPRHTRKLRSGLAGGLRPTRDSTNEEEHCGTNGRLYQPAHEGG